MSEHIFKPAELRQRSSEELKKQLDELEHELFNLRFRHHTGQLDNFMKMHHVKRNIARIKTLLKEKA